MPSCSRRGRPGYSWSRMAPAPSPSPDGGLGAPGSEVVGEARPVGRALLEERVSPLGSLVGHVRESGRLPGEDLLAGEAVVGQVEGELQHPDRLRRLRRDDPGVLQGLSLIHISEPTRLGMISY